MPIVMMSNHYHMVVETPEGNLSKGTRHLNGAYTQYINRHQRTGHVFQGRYKAVLVEQDSWPQRDQAGDGGGVSAWRVYVEGHCDYFGVHYSTVSRIVKRDESN